MEDTWTSRDLPGKEAAAEVLTKVISHPAGMD
jgi:hypothetical protein